MKIVKEVVIDPISADMIKAASWQSRMMRSIAECYEAKHKRKDLDQGPVIKPRFPIEERRRRRRYADIFIVTSENISCTPNQVYITLK